MTTRRQMRKQEKTKRVKMIGMQPPKRTEKIVRKWCLKKMDLLFSRKLHRTMQHVKKFDELMHCRLRRMPDGA